MVGDVGKGTRVWNVVVFFFQAEDGIRDVAVTGVQTCALPISRARVRRRHPRTPACPARRRRRGTSVNSARKTAAHTARQADAPQPPANCGTPTPDRKSTRLNSSHGYISYAVFCLKKKKDSTVA